ncbi:c-type cytochrome [Croceicoccus hydrothermalis]|uniref:c-type cytochrome n=1 Tax=Croceicoccus hydrothermalis TaxID=2867964 RepID=UPI001EFBD6AA|nr:cytochrome c [Croceicoccus hydrothermalis]
MAVPALATLDHSAQRGAYLASIGSCNACHTAKGGRQFAGGVKFKTDFGTLYSTNITPDTTYGIGTWDFAQFYRAMKEGVGDGGEHLYPAFPYTHFAKMDDRDIASLYAYFRTVEAQFVKNRDNAMRFPFNHRDLLYFWKRLFHDGTASPGNPQNTAHDRGRYLVESILHCSACHTPRNALGGLNEGKALQGGTYVDQVANGAYRQWAAADITGGPHGLAKWDASDIALYLKEGRNRHTVIHGPMGEVFEATKNLEEKDAAAIGIYLSEVEPAARRLDLSWLRSGIQSGERVYTVHCGTCHLPDGNGAENLGVSLRQNPLVQAKDPSTLINVILYGPELPPPPFTSNRTKMPAYGKRLSDEDIANLATYLRSSFDNNAGMVTAEQVARQR